jgi:hypothetical protein
MLFSRLISTTYKRFEYLGRFVAPGLVVLFALSTLSGCAAWMITQGLPELKCDGGTVHTIRAHSSTANSIHEKSLDSRHFVPSQDGLNYGNLAWGEKGIWITEGVHPDSAVSYSKQYSDGRIEETNGALQYCGFESKGSNSEAQPFRFVSDDGVILVSGTARVRVKADRYTGIAPDARQRDWVCEEGHTPRNEACDEEYAPIPDEFSFYQPIEYMSFLGDGSPFKSVLRTSPDGGLIEGKHFNSKGKLVAELIPDSDGQMVSLKEWNHCGHLVTEGRYKPATPQYWRAPNWVEFRGADDNEHFPYGAPVGKWTYWTNQGVEDTDCSKTDMAQKHVVNFRALHRGDQIALEDDTWVLRRAGDSNLKSPCIPRDDCFLVKAITERGPRGTVWAASYSHGFSLHWSPEQTGNPQGGQSKAQLRAVSDMVYGVTSRLIDFTGDDATLEDRTMADNLKKLLTTYPSSAICDISPFPKIHRDPMRETENCRPMTDAEVDAFVSELLEKHPELSGELSPEKVATFKQRNAKAALARAEVEREKERKAEAERREKERKAEAERLEKERIERENKAAEEERRRLAAEQEKLKERLGRARDLGFGGESSLEQVDLFLEFHKVMTIRLCKAKTAVGIQGGALQSNRPPMSNADVELAISQVGLSWESLCQDDLNRSLAEQVETLGSLIKYNSLIALQKGFSGLSYLDVLGCHSEGQCSTSRVSSTSDSPTPLLRGTVRTHSGQICRGCTVNTGWQDPTSNRIFAAKPVKTGDAGSFVVYPSEPEQSQLALIRVDVQGTSYDGGTLAWTGVESCKTGCGATVLID